jgi:signal transduction histidine kinase
MSDDRDDERSRRERDAEELARLEAELARDRKHEAEVLEHEARQLAQEMKQLEREVEGIAESEAGRDRPRDPWTRVEQAWRRHLAHRERWEERRAEHRARWKQRRRRWRELHDEREMWMRMRKDKRGWGPWWLQGRMRRRIFSWLALAFVAGAVTMGYWESTRWWHAVLVLVGLSAVSGMIAFRLTRPLLMVIRVAQDIGDGKLETRLDVDRHRGETRLLAMAINEMAERIEQQLKDQRQLLAAVSHELRTPLGHMRVLIDTARDTADRKALGELEREVLVLDDLVGRLLASSRLEFGNLECRPLDLGALVSDVATAAGVAPEAIEAIGDVRASVDPTLVRRALANLLDNARIHGGGAVAVRIERRARQVAIEVDDAGPGVPPDRRADAFRAFVPSGAGGLGLGLALVSRIAVAHNGGAWITDRPGGGARVGFTVEVVPSGRTASG